MEVGELWAVGDGAPMKEEEVMSQGGGMVGHHMEAEDMATVWEDQVEEATAVAAPTAVEEDILVVVMGMEEEEVVVEGLERTSWGFMETRDLILE